MSEVRDWHPTLILPVFMVTQSGLGMELLQVGKQRQFSLFPFLADLILNPISFPADTWASRVPLLFLEKQEV